MRILPSVFDDEHPSNGWLKRLAPAAVVVLMGLTVFMQQFLVSLSDSTLSGVLHSIASKEEVSDPGVASLTTNAKLMIKLRQELADEGVSPSSNPQATGSEADVDSIDFLDEIAHNRVDRFRVALVAAEILGPRAGIDRLRALQSEVEPGGALAGDIDWMLRWYAAQPSSVAGAVTPEARAAVIERHGWFAQLAFSLGKPASDPLRWEAASGGDQINAFFVTMGLLNLIFLLGGVIVLTIWLVSALKGSVEFRVESPSAPAQVYYETFALFCLIFIFGVMLAVALLGETSPIGLVINEMLVWGCATVVLWPRLRGVPRMEFSDDMGLNRGEGFVREIVVGIGGFVACWPVSSLVGFVIQKLFSNPDTAEATGGVPMYETPLANSWLLIILSALLSVVWAPFVEECLFRGTLHTALRSRMGPAAAVVLSSIAFGAIHPYDLAGVLQVAIMGVSFAIVREWRGSLIAPMVMHALHNGFLELEQVGTIALAH